MRTFRLPLPLALVLTVLVSPLIGQPPQDANEKEKKQIQSALKTVRSYLASGRQSSALRLLNDIVKGYPKHPATEEARKLLAELTSSGSPNRPGAVAGKASFPPTTAPKLLDATRKQAANAATLHLKFELNCPAKEAPFSGSGELKISGNSRWKLTFDAKNQAGEKGRMEAWSAGADVSSKGFQGPSPQPAAQPTRYVRQLRDFGTTSFIPVFYSILYQKIDQTQDHAPTIGDVKDLGRESVGGKQTRKIEYTVTYPAGKTIRVVAWIDERRRVPIKRETHFGAPAPLTETLTSFTIGAPIPASEFTAPSR